MRQMAADGQGWIEEREDFGPAEIEKYKKAGEIGASLELHRAIPSTNTRARELAVQGAPHGTAVLAESQTAGRGRFDRRFHSPKDGGVYISFVLRPRIEADQAVLLTPMAAVAVARAIEKIADVQTGIKWVNDVYIGDRKVCGVLCESGIDFESGRMDYVVMGIGINTGFQSFPRELADIATSVANACGKKISRGRMAAELMNALNALYPMLEEGSFMQEYRSRSMVIGRDILVLRGGESFAARAEGIGDDGSLIVTTEDGLRNTLHSGEISIRLR